MQMLAGLLITARFAMQKAAALIEPTFLFKQLRTYVRAGHR
jgi:hypothetical protein